MVLVLLLWVPRVTARDWGEPTKARMTIVPKAAHLRPPPSRPPHLYCSECAGKADICTDLCLLQVTLLYHSLMGLAGAFDSVVELTSAIRKLANNLVSPLGCHPEG